ncbi:ATP-binding cassette domain-containing protein [Blastopirellula sp. JC732]|uniref:ATP-binding cassette domain-containing protein n=1 Tax=Blastopirellula sediminis TaxID=2894196 RepID=A0A9X1SF02_9BACT|nr:ATP-binding cassette domain-containing protein [Blastopirellula sediminis]MCC9607880.1 ATP-binding cassette domain-containing protein [Blastopirellula sediminis]MCC9627327.1 ATP-binding cassette domain-containing protein [Blastopirellula sediminis]
MSLSLNCTFRYEQGFSLHAELASDAHVTALCGASGSGKTTILMLIAGLLQPQSGVIRYGETSWVDVAEKKFVPPHQRRVGVMFQEPRLFPHFNVQENLNYGFQRRRGEATQMAKAVETLEIGDLLKRPVGSLSGGQKQRVALARAIVSSPELLLLDEPLTSVEPSLQERIAEYVKRVAKEFATPIVLVSHSVELVEQMAERTFWVKDGSVSG